MIKKAKFAEMEANMTIQKTQTGELFTVTAVLEAEQKLEAISGDNKVKRIAKSTLERYYKLIEHEQSTTETAQVEEINNDELMSEQQDNASGNEAQPEPMSLQAIRERLIEYGKTLSEEVTAKDAGYYIGLKETFNFAEIHNGKKQFNVIVIAESLPDNLLKKCIVVPISYGWTLNAKYKVLDEASADIAMEMIKLSREYRATHLKISRKTL